MKKKVIIILLIIILGTFTFISNANTVQVTRESLDASFQKMVSNDEFDWDSIEVTENTIVLKDRDDSFLTEADTNEVAGSNSVVNTNEIANNNLIGLSNTIDQENTLTNNIKSYILNYDLTNKPEFSIDLTFNKTMKGIDFENEKTKILFTLYGFIATADICGRDSKESSSYILSSLLQSQDKMNFSTLEFEKNTNAIIEAKKIYGNNETVMENEFFTLKTQKISEDENQYKIKAVCTVDTSADFTKIAGTKGKLKESANSIQEAQKQYSQSIEYNYTINNYLSSIKIKEENEFDILKNKLFSKNNSSEFASDSSQIIRIPQTGTNFNFINILKIIIVITICAFRNTYITG